MTITSAMLVSSNCRNQSANINHIASQGKGSLLDGSVPVKLGTLTNTVTLSYGITGNQSDKLSSGHSANILAQSFAVGAGCIHMNIPSAGGLDLNHARGDIAFLQSIKKGSVSATLCVFDIKYRANQPLQISQQLSDGISDISGEAENFDDNHLFLSSDVRYSDRAPAKSGVRIETLNIQTATHDAPCVFFCVRAYAHLQNTVLCRSDSMVALVGQPSGWLVSVCASSLNPVSVTTPIEIETSGGDSALIQTEIIVMMAIPAQTQFKFLFLAVKRADSTDIPHRIEATAPNEHSARLLLVRDYILSFAGRVPVREVAA